MGNNRLRQGARALEATETARIVLYWNRQTKRWDMAAMLAGAVVARESADTTTAVDRATLRLVLRRVREELEAQLPLS